MKPSETSEETPLPTAALKLRICALTLAFLSFWFSRPFTQTTPLSHSIMWATAVALLLKRAFTIQTAGKHETVPLSSWGWLLPAMATLPAVLYWPESKPLMLAVATFFLAESISGTIDESLSAKLFLPLGVLFLAIPALPYVMYWIELPLRLVSTHLTRSLLGLAGLPVSAAGTELRIGEMRLAITTACSGIVFFETLLWLAWIVVLHFHPPGWQRLLHYVFIIPIVLAANTLRISILAVSAHFYGVESILGPLHSTLGYAMIVTATLLFILLNSVNLRPVQPERTSSCTH